MVQTLDVKTGMQLEELTCFKKALLSVAWRSQNMFFYFNYMASTHEWSLNSISTDLENALEVYDEMKHMFSDDFWKVRKFNFFQGTVWCTIRAPTWLQENLAVLHFSSCNIHEIWQLYANAQIRISYMTASALNNWTRVNHVNSHSGSCW